MPKRMTNLLLKCLCLIFPFLAGAFKKEFRQCEFTLHQPNERNFSSDPTLYGFSEAMRNEVGQISTETIEKFRGQFNHIIDTYIHGSQVVHMSDDDTRYFSICDDDTKLEFMNQNKAKSNWRKFLRSKPGTHSVVDLQNALNGLVEFENEKDFNIVLIAITLSRLHIYDLAALVMFTYMPHFYQNNWNGDMDTIIQSLNVMAESHRLLGDIDISTQYFLKVIMLLEDDGMRPLQAANQLRLLLFSPPLPVPYEEAVSERKVMVDDLYAFAGYLSRHGITLPLSVLQLCITSTPFHVSHQGINDYSFQRAMSNAFTQLCPELNFVSPRLKAHLNIKKNSTKDLNALTPSGRKKHRVGFISPHLYQHSIGNILFEAIVNLETQYEDMEVTVFLINTDTSGATPTTRKDSVTDALEDVLGVRFLRLPGDIAMIRETVGGEQYGVDVLIYTDVGMDVSGFILAQSRLAPIQIAWWGHPVTTGSLAIDYFLGLDVEVKEAGLTQYSEQLVRIETMNTSPLSTHQQKRVDAAEVNSTVFGIPEHAVFGMVLGQLFKLHPAFDEALFKILGNTPENAYLVLIREMNSATNRQLYSRWESYQQKICCAVDIDEQDELDDLPLPSCCSNITLYRHLHYRRHQEILAGELPKKMNNAKSSLDRQNEDSEDILYAKFLDHVDSGKSPYVLHRLRFIHYNHYDEALVTSRVILDTFPYGGCLTAHDALANFVPFVVLPSNYSRGKCAEGLYRQINHLDLLASSSDRYAGLVSQLLNDKAFREEQARQIEKKVVENLSRNEKVSEEWAVFLRNVIRANVN